LHRYANYGIVAQEKWPKSGQKLFGAGMTKVLSKSDVRYWLERVFKEVTRGANGRKYAQSDYSVRIRFQDRRERFQLDTPNKYEASRKAREIYGYLSAHSWEQALKKFKSSKIDIQSQSPTTIGEFLNALCTLHPSKTRTIQNYAGSLRKIVADLAALPSGGRGGNPQNHRIWRGKVEAVELSFLTPGKIQKWKESFLVRAGHDPIKQRSARVSVNTFLREGRSLFAPRMLEGLEGVVLPEPLPFSGVRLEKRSIPRYQSTFDVMALIRDARAELATSEPEQFKIFLLAVMTGLRRNEIDKLEWTSFNWHANTISIVPTKYFRTKSDSSTRNVWTPPEMMEIFRGFRAKTGGTFVIESDVKPSLGKVHEHYRGLRLYSELIGWLKRHGVKGPKPLHTLRKEYGSLVAAKFGIFAAKEALGHRDIATTAMHYLEVKDKPTLGLGELLTAPENVVPIAPDQAAEAGA
jgi:integrase